MDDIPTVGTSKQLCQRRNVEVHYIRRVLTSNADGINLHSSHVRFSRVQYNLSVLSSWHNSNTVRLHVEVFLSANLYLTLSYMIARLECSFRVTARNAVRVWRTFVERVLCNGFLSYNNEAE